MGKLTRARWEGTRCSDQCTDMVVIASGDRSGWGSNSGCENQSSRARQSSSVRARSWTDYWQGKASRNGTRAVQGMQLWLSQSSVVAVATETGGYGRRQGRRSE